MLLFFSRLMGSQLYDKANPKARLRRFRSRLGVTQNTNPIAITLYETNKTRSNNSSGTDSNLHGRILSQSAGDLR